MIQRSNVRPTHDTSWGDTYKAAAHATSTLKRRTWMRQYWRDWCAATGIDVLGAEPHHVEAYVRYLLELHPVTRGANNDPIRYGVSVDTARRCVAEVGALYGEAGLASPTDDRGVRDLLRGAGRMEGRAVRRVSPVTREHLRRLPRATLLDARDRAVMYVGVAGLLRGAEIAALRVEDLGPSAKGGYVLRIRRSKTDQDGTGADVVLAPAKDCRDCPVQALSEWLERSGISDGPLFPSMPGRSAKQTADALSGSEAIRAIVRRRLTAMGVNAAEYGAHSLRAGGASLLAAHGAPLMVVQHAGRWRSPSMPSVYVRGDLSDTLAAYQ